MTIDELPTEQTVSQPGVGLESVQLRDLYAVSAVPRTTVPVGTWKYKNGDVTLGVATLEGAKAGSAEAALAGPWAEAIYPCLQNPAAYRSVADLALRLTTQPGALIAFDVRVPQKPLAFGIQDPERAVALASPEANADKVISFDEYGVVWPKEGAGLAPARHVGAVGAVMMHAINRNPVRADTQVYVVRHPADSRDSRFFEVELCLRSVSVAAAGYVATVSQVESGLNTNFLLEEIEDISRIVTEETDEDDEEI